MFASLDANLAKKGTHASDKAKTILTEKFGITANSFDHSVMSVLALACDEGDVTNERLRYVLNMHKTEISGLLKLMVQRGLLEAYGYGRGMRYRLPVKGMNVLRADDVVTDIADRNQKIIDASSSGNSASYSASSEANSASYSASSEPNSASCQKKRLSKEELKSMVVSICKDWVSIDDIVKKSGKSTSCIRNVVIPLLLAEKTIVMLYPGTPRNPNQKYKVRE